MRSLPHQCTSGAGGSGRPGACSPTEMCSTALTPLDSRPILPEAAGFHALRRTDMMKFWYYFSGGTTELLDTR
jgi:hypothetical protein